MNIRKKMKQMPFELPEFFVAQLHRDDSGVADELWFIFKTHLTHTGSLKDCFKAVNKSNRLKRVVLNEIKPYLRDLIFDAFKQVLKAPCVRKVSV